MNDSDTLRRARTYPYDAPAGSYTWHHGEVRDFAPEDRRGRTPVLAFGSNRAPERLHQKFAHLGNHRIPVEAARLTDFDVVYAAHITSYGAVPAMLQRVPGVAVDIAVTWLDDAQLPIMHDSEMSAANYVFARLDDVALSLSGGGSADHAFCYVGTRGHLLSDDGGTIPLLAIRAEGRRDSAAATGEVLEMIRSRVTDCRDADQFVLDLVRDETYRRHVSELISKDAVPFDYPKTVIRR